MRIYDQIKIAYIIILKNSITLELSDSFILLKFR